MYITSPLLYSNIMIEYHKDYKEISKSTFMAKYGHVGVIFESYYKHYFTFSAVLPSGYKLLVTVGGDAERIYNFKVCGGDQVQVKDLGAHQGRVLQEHLVVESFFSHN